MIDIGNGAVALRISEDGLSVGLEDRRRDCAWQLDTRTWGFAESAPAGIYAYAPLTPFSPGQVSRSSPRTVEAVYSIPGGSARYSWDLLEDGLRVRLTVQSDRVVRVSHPGSFVPATGGLELLLPLNQGILARDAGPRRAYRFKVPGDVSMFFCAYLGNRGGLLAAQEDLQDRSLVFGRDERGLFTFFEVSPGAVEGWYQRKLRLYPVDRSITAVCKRYRRRVIERGNFVGWKEKLQSKPTLAKYFGALIAMIGYNQGQTTDYVKSARAVRDLGFDTVFYYPVRFNAMNRDFRMGGDPPIWLSDDVLAGMKSAGGMLSAWNWTEQALDDGTEELHHILRCDQKGNPIDGWQMDGKVFRPVCRPYQAEYMRQQYAGPMAAMDWTHFDQVGGGARPCFSQAHEKHGCQPLTANGDQAAVAELLGQAVNGARMTSAEVFNEYLTKFYDMGTNKYLPAWGEARRLSRPLTVLAPKGWVAGTEAWTGHCIPVPMTGLVFHDSAEHKYWDHDTYNATPTGFLRDDGIGLQGAGDAEKKAAFDALYGCAPFVMPFGRMYHFVDMTRSFDTFSYEVSVQDAEVQRALRAALPVARLHKQIGPCEMLSFESLTDDFAVQTTRFSDGTQVVANISDDDRPTEEYGMIPANSWRAFAPAADHKKSTDNHRLNGTQ